MLSLRISESSTTKFAISHQLQKNDVVTELTNRNRRLLNPTKKYATKLYRTITFVLATDCPRAANEVDHTDFNNFVLKYMKDIVSKKTSVGGEIRCN